MIHRRVLGINSASESAARIFGVGLIFGLLLVVGIAYWAGRSQAVLVHAAMPENGGFRPADLTVEVGKPLHLRLVSDDVTHGFAIGQSDQPALDLKPGQVTETTLVFDQPGRYTFYCTRWCGPNHWRMRGTIEVAGANSEVVKASPPLYVALGLDIDAKHPAQVVPEERPSAVHGARLAAGLPAEYLALEYYQTHSPAQVWLDLRSESALTTLRDQQIWDLVAYIWMEQTTPETLSEAERLYSDNCAACHGENGAGDGVMADDIAVSTSEAVDNVPNAAQSGEHAAMTGHTTTTPTDFTDPSIMLGASPAVLNGKIVRGGMGTGMPYWGPIFTEDQIWALVSYLWSFQFDFHGG